MSDQELKNAITAKHWLEFFKEHTARQMAVEMALQKLGITREEFSGAVEVARGRVEEAKDFAGLQSILDSVVGTMLRDIKPSSDKPS